MDYQTGKASGDGDGDLARVLLAAFLMSTGDDMWGRFFGLAVGLVLVGEGVVLWRPQFIGGLPTTDLGPFTPYRLLIALLAGAVGAAVAIASLLRETSKPRKRPAAAVDWNGDAPAVLTPAFAHAEPMVQPLAAPPAPTPHAAEDEELAPFPGLEPSPAVQPVAIAAPAPAAAIPLPNSPSAPPSADRVAFLELTDQGHQLRAAGQLEDALDPYGDALAIARRRESGSPGDATARRDLAAALTNVADVHDREGRLEQAIPLHEESLALRRGLAAEAPADLGVQRLLSTGLERLADAREFRGHRTRARDLFRERLSLAERLAAEAPGDAALASDLATTRERLAELDEALAT